MLLLLFCQPKCPYSHDPIDDNQKADLVRMVKSVPCKKVAENGKCLMYKFFLFSYIYIYKLDWRLIHTKDSCYDRKCIYGHICPNYTECWYLRQEKCRFPPCEYHHHYFTPHTSISCVYQNTDYFLGAHLPTESNSSYPTTPISTKLSIQENESETEDNISNISITFA